MTVVHLHPPDAVEGVLVEVRREVLRDAKATLQELDEHGLAEDRGRLLGLLDTLALLVRMESPKT